MNFQTFRMVLRSFRTKIFAAFLLLAVLMAAQSSTAQGSPSERTYRQSKSAVEKALKELSGLLGCGVAEQ